MILTQAAVSQFMGQKLYLKRLKNRAEKKIDTVASRKIWYMYVYTHNTHNMGLYGFIEPT